MAYEDLDAALSAIDGDAYAKAVSQLLPLMSSMEGIAAMRDFTEQHPNLADGIQIWNEHADLNGLNAPKHANVAAGMLLALMALDKISRMPDSE